MNNKQYNSADENINFKQSAHSHEKVDYDVIVIGAGLLGCFTARALSKYKLRICVLEASEDVCTGVSKANSSIVYTGYDMKPNSMKACMTVRANKTFDSLCRQLGVEFSRCGSLMVAFGPRGCKTIQDKFDQGITNGVSGLRIVSGSEAREIEPALSNDVQAALFSPSVGTVMPWDLCIAAAENAVANGAEFRFGAKVVAIHTVGESYVLETEDGEAISTRAVVNCAGIHSYTVASLVGFTRVHIELSKAEYVVYDSVSSHKLKHIVFHEPEEKGKGITAVPCIDGHVIVEGLKEDAPDNDFYSVTSDGLGLITSNVQKVLPTLAHASIITSFAGARPNPQITQKDANSMHKSIYDFCVEYNHEKPNFVSFIGVKTPGLTCANELGAYGTSLVVSYLNTVCDVCENKEFSPTNRAPLCAQPVKTYSKNACSQEIDTIVCTCEGVNESEIVRAISMGAKTIDGVKRRTGAHMGNCQGSGCEIKIARIIARELNIPLSDVCKNAKGSHVFCTDITDYSRAKESK